MQSPFSRSLLAVVLLTLLSSGVARADVLGVDSAWIDMAQDGGTLRSVTVGGQVLADLTFATSGTVDASASATNPDRTFWNSTLGTNPVTANAALSGGIATRGILNSAVTFQFGRNLGLAERLVFLDAENGGLSENVQIFPVDSLGAKIGDFSLTLSESGDKSGSYGANLVPGGFTLAAEDLNEPIAGFNLRGVSFTLDDMTGSFGNLALAQGFSVEDNFGGSLSVDPALAAIAAFVPPSANFNGDSAVDAADLAILASNYGNYGAGQAGGDANLDGTVDYRDYLLWRQASLDDPSSLAGAVATQSVPEPTSIGLVASAVGIAWLRFRRKTTCD